MGTLNKESLANFYTDHMLLNAPKKLGRQQLFVACGKDKVVFKITATATTEVEELRSNQEEADTRIALHTAFASNIRMKSVVIRSPDTDILVLLLHHRALIKAHSLYFWTDRVGVNTDQTRYIPIHTIYQKLTPEQLNILLSAYCLTG